jgi:hypothetical protein
MPEEIIVPFAQLQPIRQKDRGCGKKRVRIRVCHGRAKDKCCVQRLRVWTRDAASVFVNKRVQPGAAFGNALRRRDARQGIIGRSCDLSDKIGNDLQATVSE